MRFENDLHDTSVPPLPIVVVGFDKTLSCIIDCRDWLGVNTHWYGGHTIQCLGSGSCPACDANHQWVRKYYVVAHQERNDRQAIVMITPTAAEVLIKYHKHLSGFLGLGIVVGRAAKRRNAPMTLRANGYHPETEEFDMKRFEHCMERIYRANAQIKSA